MQLILKSGYNNRHRNFVKSSIMPTSNAFILYSFLRCPYAMRARMALMLNQVTVEIREIILKHKPPSMLLASPKGTVPVLINEGNVIDESRDIIDFSISQSQSPAFELPNEQQLALIDTNDNEFKSNLDRYKYHDRFVEKTQQQHRQAGEVFLQQLEDKLTNSLYLFGDKFSYADIAIFPFIRQFAHVDKSWFEQADYPHLQRWLNAFLISPAFVTVMQKLPLWQEGDVAIYFPPLSVSSMSTTL